MKGLHPKFQEKRPDMVELFLEVKGFNSGVPSEVEKACQDNPVALERVAQLDVPMLMLSADFDWFFSRAMLSRSAQHCRKCTSSAPAMYFAFTEPGELQEWVQSEASSGTCSYS